MKPERITDDNGDELEHGTPDYPGQFDERQAGLRAVDWRLRLKPLREDLGMGLSATARRAGITKAYLWKIERAGAEPTVRVARRIALALRVPLCDLLDEVGAGGPQEPDHD